MKLNTGEIRAQVGSIKSAVSWSPSRSLNTEELADIKALIILCQDIAIIEDSKPIG